MTPANKLGWEIMTHIEHEGVRLDEFVELVVEFLESAPSGFLPTQFMEHFNDHLSGRSMEGQMS
jgi:hypothetical protein